MTAKPFGQTYHTDTRVTVGKGSLQYGFPERGIMEITKEKLEYWRHKEGKTNAEIARMTGKTLGVINMMFARHKIRQRSRGTPQKTIDAIHKMLGDGSSPSEIADALGIKRGVVYKYAPEKKTEEDFGLPETMQVAEKRKPNIFKTVVNGKSYIDVTDLYIPH